VPAAEPSAGIKYVTRQVQERAECRQPSAESAQKPAVARRSVAESRPPGRLPEEEGTTEAEKV